MLTALFLLIRRTRFKQIAKLEHATLMRSESENSSVTNEEVVRARLSFVVPDKTCQDDAAEKMFSQTGMSRSLLGAFLKWAWRTLFVLSNVLMLLFCLDEYYWIKFDWTSESGHHDWTNAGKPMLLMLAVTHCVMLLFSLFNADLIFMLPAPLSTCSHVLVSEEDPDVDTDLEQNDSSVSDFGSEISERGETSCWRRLLLWITEYKQQFRRRLRWKLEVVHVVDCEQGLVRWFYHTSIWYKWSHSRGFFHVTRFEVPLAVHMHKQFEIGGLDTD